MILQLNPPLPMVTPKGKGLAHFLIDYGPEHHLMWVCFLDDSGECWTFENPQVRIQWNITLGRVSKNTDAKAKADDDFDDPPNGKPDNAEPTQIG